MREMKKATCRYCGLQTDMHVLKKRKISDGKPILAYPNRRKTPSFSYGEEAARIR